MHAELSFFYWSRFDDPSITKQRLTHNEKASLLIGCSAFKCKKIELNGKTMNAQLFNSTKHFQFLASSRISCCHVSFFLFFLFFLFLVFQFAHSLNYCLHMKRKAQLQLVDNQDLFTGTKLQQRNLFSSSNDEQYARRVVIDKIYCSGFSQIWF